MCCEICKIGFTIGSSKLNCQSTSFLNNHLWGEVYHSCCTMSNTKVNKMTTDLNTDG